MAVPKKVIVICGPTASGKTRFAIDLAKELNTEIVSSDSRQCYKELDIGVAKPSAEELSEINHYFINSHSVSDKLNAAVFESYALNKIELLFNTYNTVIVVGGTGLYVNALLYGLDEIPAIDPAIEERLKEDFKTYGTEWLIKEIREKDSLFYSKGEIKNPHRTLRALAVKLSTGKSILEYHRNKRAERDFIICKIWLEVPRKELYKRINERVDQMMDAGLLAEVKNLYKYRDLDALQTVGYQELFEYLDGKVSLDRAVELIKRNTRHYAKRQITWFSKYFLID